MEDCGAPTVECCSLGGRHGDMYNKYHNKTPWCRAFRYPCFSYLYPFSPTALIVTTICWRKKFGGF